MDLKEALEKIEENKEIKEKLADKKFCSAVAFSDTEGNVEGWELNYYDKKTNSIMTVGVKKEVVIKSLGPPFKERPVEEIDLENIKISFKKALKIAKSLQKKKHKEDIQRIFISLQREGSQFWSVGFITKNMRIIQVKIDAKKGKIIESKVHALFEGKVM